MFYLWFQLEAFLMQRCSELNEESNVLSTNQFQTAKASIQLDSNRISSMVTEVKDIISQLTSVQIQDLMKIRNSPRLVILDLLNLNTLFEPHHEIFNNVVCATSEASDQPVHTGSQIRAFASRLNILGLLSY